MKRERVPAGTAPEALGEWHVELPCRDGAATQRLREDVLAAMQRVPLANIAAGRMAP